MSTENIITEVVKEEIQEVVKPVKIKKESKLKDPEFRKLYNKKYYEKNKKKILDYHKDLNKVKQQDPEIIKQRKLLRAEKMIVKKIKKEGYDDNIEKILIQYAKIMKNYI